MDREWNPRYVEYARANARTPEDQLAVDEKKMWRYMNWIDHQIVEYCDVHGIGRDSSEWRAACEMDGGFDQWLAEKVYAQ